MALSMQPDIPPILTKKRGRPKRIFVKIHKEPLPKVIINNPYIRAKCGAKPKTIPQPKKDDIGVLWALQ
jgi:hypothetical protein